MWVSWLFVELCILATAALLVQERSLRSLVAVLGVVRWSAVGTVLAVVGLGLLQITAASLTPAGLAAVAQGSADGDVLSRLGFGLLVLGLAVKAGLFPLNAWGLAVGQAAPARVLALLSGAVPALTLVALARVLSGGELAGADVLRVVGILSALAGAFGMWRADDFPAFLMQLSLASIGGIAVGFSLPGPAGLFAALALLFHFLLIQSALFVLAHRWRGRLTDLTAIAWRMPWTAAVLVLFAASLVGVPPLPGFWAKLMLLMSLAEYQGAEAMLVVLAYLLVTAVEAAAWLRLMRIGYARAAKDSAAALQEDAALGVVRVDRLPSLLRSGPWARAYQLLVAVLLLVATLMIGPVAEDLNRLVVPLLAQRVSGCCDAGGWG
nr:proton-conducting transporter membrane subunit [Rhabdochromatium marinum]